MPIALKTRLGCIALSIAAEPKADASDKIAALALKQLTFHDAPSKAFRKGSKVKRGDAYSQALMMEVQEACRQVFAPFFDVIEIQAGEYVAPIKDQPKALIAARDVLAKAGVAEAELRKAFPALYVEEQTEEPAEEEEAA